jgi:hypothetical protein
MTDTTKTKDETPTDPQDPGQGGGTDDTTGHHETNGTGGGGTTVSPMGHHETNGAPTGTTA